MKGKVHKYGDNIDTDVIIPARHCNTLDFNELAKHCMEDLDTEFVKKIEPGDILAAGENFGCGSSREMAPLAIKYSGISCVIAKSYARIFYRNAINIGLPIVECRAFIDDLSDRDEVEVKIREGLIDNITLGKKYNFHPGDRVVEEIIENGGLVNYVKKRLGKIG